MQPAHLSETTISKLYRRVAFDDINDRLNYLYTSILIAFISISTGIHQYFGKSIDCLVPADYINEWSQYAEKECFTHGIYVIPGLEHLKQIPQRIDDADKTKVTYYMWVPYMFLGQSLMFYLPIWIWKVFHAHGGLNLKRTLTDAKNLNTLRGEDRKEDLKKLVLVLEKYLKFGEQRRTPLHIFCFRFGCSLGSYMTMLYLLVKGLYVINILVQFSILNRFLGSSYFSWGIQIFTDLYNGREWINSTLIPRKTLCDVKRFMLGNANIDRMECGLMMNEVYERIYLFIWFWLMFLAISNSMNFIYSSITLISPKQRVKNVRRLIKPSLTETRRQAEKSDDDVLKFSHKGLQADGVLILRFIEKQTSKALACEIAKKMHDNYEYASREEPLNNTDPKVTKNVKYLISYFCMKVSNDTDHTTTNDKNYPTCCVCMKARTVLIVSMTICLIIMAILVLTVIGIETTQVFWTGNVGEIWEIILDEACPLLLPIFLILGSIYLLILLAAIFNCSRLLAVIYAASYVPLVMLLGYEGSLFVTYLSRILDSEKMQLPGYFVGQTRVFVVFSLIVFILTTIYSPLVILLHKTTKHAKIANKEKSTKAVENLI